MGSKGSNTTTSSFKPPAEFMKAYKEALGMARTATGQPYQQYQGQLVAGLTPSQQQGIANINAAQGMALPAIQRGMGLTNEAAQYAREGAEYGRQGGQYIQQGGALTQEAAERNRLAAQGITPELYQQFYSPYVRDVAQSTFANLMESQAQQQSGLKSGAIQAGAFGGDRGGVAQAEMARQQQLANAMSMSNIYNQGYEQAMNLAGQQVANLGTTAGQLANMGQQYGNLGQQYAGLGTQIGSMGQQIGAMGQQYAGLGAGAQASVLQGAQAQMAAGAQEQATEQGRLQAAYEQWMQRQSYPYQQAQFFANIAQGLGAGAGGTSSTTAPAPNMFSQILGGIGAIGSIYGASDKRVKENIEAVGTLNDGQTIYRYNFKGDPKTQIGLLAQEVEHHKPGAVAEVKGLKMVNYKDATDDAASMGGVVSPSEYRQGLAGGGIPYFPYGDARAYVPEGKIGGRGANIPPDPTAAKDEGLAKDWKELMPLSKEQASGLRELASDVGIDLPEKGDISKIFKKTSVGPTEAEKAWITLSSPDEGLFGSRLASGGLVGRHHYADGGYEPGRMDEAIDEAAGLGAAPEPVASAEESYPTPEEVEAYIASAAQKRGIDPDVAVRVWRSEGRSGDPREAWQSKIINKKGEREESYGPYQLYMKGGLGNEMLKETGLSPADPRNWKPSVDFSLDKAAVGGWSPWHGAKAIGLDDRAGLANAKALAEYSSPDSGVVPVPASAEGLAAAGDESPAPESGGLLSRIKFDPSKLIASEDNPSLIEKIMGRRLSPEARAAVMNASFALMAGRSPYFMTNLGEAGVVGSQTYYNALQQKRAQEKQDAEFALKEQERQEKEARQQMIEEAISQLPPEQQLAARLAPEKFFGAQAESIFGTTDLPALVEEYNAAKAEGFKGTLEDWKKIGGSGGADLGLQPVPLVDAENNFIGFGQMSKSGGLYYNGQPIDNVDVRPMNPADLNKIKEIGKGEGRAIGEARGDIAGAEKQASVTIEKISELEDNPNLDAAVGWTSYLPDFAVNSNVIDVRAKVDELMGGAFLEARTILKGGGQITDFESARAERAYSRMERAIQASNPQVFRDALKDFREAVLDGVEKLRATAQLPSTGGDEIPDVSTMTDEQLEAISNGQ